VKLHLLQSRLSVSSRWGFAVRWLRSYEKLITSLHNYTKLEIAYRQRLQQREEFVAAEEPCFKGEEVRTSVNKIFCSIPHQFKYFWNIT
jgi:hypothetical protein